MIPVILRYMRFTTIGLTLLACGLGAEEWSRFRGPTGAGIAEGSGYPAEFGEGRNVVWTRAIPAGKSSPVLTADSVFLTAERGADLVVLCLDRKTGVIRWERTTPRPRREFQHSLNTGASATPVTDGENVYAFFGNFGLISFDGVGKERWRRPLGPFTSLWGMAASPVLAGGAVIMVLDGFGQSYMAAFDQKTGVERWRTARSPFALNYSTPVVRGEEVVVAGPGKIAGYDVRTGTEKWSGKLPVASYVASPALSSNMAFALSYSVETVPSFDEFLKTLDKNGDGALSPGEFGPGDNARILEGFGQMAGNKDGTVERAEWVGVWREWTGRSALTAAGLDGNTTAWTYTKSVGRVSTPLLYEGLVYMVANGGILSAIDVETGVAVKTGRLTGALDNYFSSPVFGDGKLYFTAESGKVVVVKPGRDWQILAVNDLGEETYATPALSKGQLFVRTANTLRVYGSVLLK